MGNIVVEFCPFCSLDGVSKFILAVKDVMCSLRCISVSLKDTCIGLIGDEALLYTLIEPAMQEVDNKLTVIFIFVLKECGNTIP